MFNKMDEDKQRKIKEQDGLDQKISEIDESEFTVCQKLAYSLIMMAVNYRFEVSIIIIYNSIICIFKILYDQCIECKDNLSENWLRLILILEFVVLALITQIKLNFSNGIDSCCTKLGNVFKSVLVVLSLMHLTQTRTLQCWLQEYNIWATWICMGLVLIVVSYDFVTIFRN